MTLDSPPSPHSQRETHLLSLIVLRMQRRMMPTEEDDANRGGAYAGMCFVLQFCSYFLCKIAWLQAGAQ